MEKLNKLSFSYNKFILAGHCRREPDLFREPSHNGVKEIFFKLQKLFIQWILFHLRINE